VALWQEDRNRKQGVVHEFADSELYWKLALNLAAGKPYDDGKRQVLRTPGYPVFLAGCIRLFGDSTTGARHAQAAVGATSCVLLFFLVRSLLGTQAAWIAACWAAIYPFAVFLSAVLLSESVFTFVLLIQLLCFVKVREALNYPSSSSGVGSGVRGPLVWAAWTGLTGALATLVRPSWFLVIPVTALLLPAISFTSASTDAKSRVRRAIHGLGAAGVLLIAYGVTLTPWWVRNWNVTGHFVPTTLWVGASLYDAWNEHATGASNMRFMDRPDEYGLATELNQMSEWEQDRYLRSEAWRFAREHPGRIAELAWIKFIRFWNPLPNASEWRSWPLRLVSLFTCGPSLALAAIAAWRQRRNWSLLAILGGPVVYFCIVHLIFVSSVRYREAAMLPVFGLAAAALQRAETVSSKAALLK
jgi:4-amino-4-deoxy-L-arabinose transferase-like glycosyltransferase